MNLMRTLSINLDPVKNEMGEYKSFCSFEIRMSIYNFSYMFMFCNCVRIADVIEACEHTKQIKTTTNTSCSVPDLLVRPQRDFVTIPSPLMSTQSSVKFHAHRLLF